MQPKIEIGLALFRNFLPSLIFILINILNYLSQGDLLTGKASVLRGPSPE